MIAIAQLRAHRSQLIALADQHKADNVRVFASVARDEGNDESDVDFLVHFREGASLFDLIYLKEGAARILGVEVDVVSDRGLSPYLTDRIFGEARPL